MIATTEFGASASDAIEGESKPIGNHFNFICTAASPERTHYASTFRVEHFSRSELHVPRGTQGGVPTYFGEAPRPPASRLASRLGGMQQQPGMELREIYRSERFDEDRPFA